MSQDNSTLCKHAALHALTDDLDTGAVDYLTPDNTFQTGERQMGEVPIFAAVPRRLLARTYKVWNPFMAFVCKGLRRQWHVMHGRWLQLSMTPIWV
jgi:hypothetical protein